MESVRGFLQADSFDDSPGYSFLYFFLIKLNYMKIKIPIYVRKQFTDQITCYRNLILKLSLLCLAFLIFFPFNIHSQNFIPIVDEKKSWNCAWELPDWQESYTIRFEKDTIINGVDYTKIIRDMHFYSTAEIIGYIREDSSGRIYSMNTSFDEGLLYDFSANQGDTILMRNTMMDWWDYGCPFFAELTIVVDTIYTIDTQDGVTRRVLTVRRATDILQEIWIEGIGSLAGVIKSGANLYDELSCPSIVWNYLMCYFEDDSLVYYHTFLGEHDCRHYYNINVEEESKNTSQFKIMPNPFNQNLSISFENPVYGEKHEITIKTLVGRIVYKETLNSDISLDLSFLSKGIYLLVLINRDFQYTTKIIKL